MTLLNPFFGEFGGMYVPQILIPALLQLETVSYTHLTLPTICSV